MLCPQDLERCRTHSGEWSQLAAPLARLVQHSQIGRLLFEPMLEQVEAAERATLLQESLASLSKDATPATLLTAQRIAAFATQMETMMQRMSGHDRRKVSKRMIEVELLGDLCQIEVGPAGAEWETRLHAELRRLSWARADGLTPLPMELWAHPELAAKAVSEPCLVSVEALAPLEEARKQAVSLLQASGCKTLHESVRVLQKHRSLLSSVDRGWRLEVSWLESAAPDAVRRQMAAALRAMMPSECRAVPLKESAGALASYCNDDSSGRLGAHIQGQIRAFSESVAAMLRGVTPDPKASGALDPKSVCFQAWAQIPYFATLQSGELAEGVPPDTIVGTEAIVARLAWLESRKAKVTLADLDVIQAFKLWLPEDAQVTLRGLCLEVLARQGQQSAVAATSDSVGASASSAVAPAVMLGPKGQASSDPLDALEAFW